MRNHLSVTCAAALLASSEVGAFTVRSDSAPTRTSTALYNEVPTASRRRFFGTVGAAAGAVATSSLLQGPVAPAHAAKLSKVNAKLEALGLPAMGKVPDGFSPLLELWGKGANRFPLLVNFAHPLDWVVTTPSLDLNSEDGTVQAGEYGKGDTATFFVYEDEGNVADIASQPKSFFENVLQKAISQKSANIYQNFKVTNIQPTKGGYQDQTYMIVDFKYQLVTGAGFEVDRKAVASVTSQGKAVEALWCASTAVRYKKLEPALRDIASSFRVYSDGLDMLVPKQIVEEY
uniref:PsbP C-terminal domain-containing protein n=1 Tax=Pseudictyota dubia TaxID=2749911 RepID=A0A7R9WJF7_9STRA|mmetsp:Transcript_7979/g.14543  ORF Transcript_7979/g.14543 Transcript_7979/m.14543 type:complete len:289 (+) Transcript_7979:114-980(+)